MKVSLHEKAALKASCWVPEIHMHDGLLKRIEAKNEGCRTHAEAHEVEDGAGDHACHSPWHNQVINRVAAQHS